ncbi:MAG: UPF0280 family protein [Syntrophobacterales bacterium]|jgi:hypothetical protein|nr:UPF0280 family protein [Syntrophobacterales bacterium]
MEYRERTYRHEVNAAGLIFFQVAVRETDLFVAADADLSALCRETVVKYRRQLENYIRRRPDFLHSLSPLAADPLAPPIVQTMLAVAEQCGVGPMAAVAGTMAEYVARDLRSFTRNIIVENGGDIYLDSLEERRVAVFAGESPLSGKTALRIRPEAMPMGVCTSSATVGPSLSFGRADAVCVLSASAALADAAASRIGNQVRTGSDIKAALKIGAGIPGIRGVVIIIGDKLGAWGEIEFCQ